MFIFFFFQAEDGIRDADVTGVQTCALPILGDVLSRMTNDVDMVGQTYQQSFGTLVTAVTMFFGSIVMMFITSWILAITAKIGRRRVGKECRSRWSPYH